MPKPVQFIIADNKPVLRQGPGGLYYLKVMGANVNDIDLSRVDAGTCPLLFNHDKNTQLGKVTRVWQEGNKLYGEAELIDESKDNERQALADDLSNGMRSGISPTCDWSAYGLERVGNYDGLPLYEPRGWELAEVSSVTIPANATAATVGSFEHVMEFQALVAYNELKDTASRQEQEREAASLEATQGGTLMDPKEQEHDGSAVDTAALLKELQAMRQEHKASLEKLTKAEDGGNPRKEEDKDEEDGERVAGEGEREREYQASKASLSRNVNPVGYIPSSRDIEDNAFDLGAYLDYTRVKKDPRAGGGKTMVDGLARLERDKFDRNIEDSRAVNGQEAAGGLKMSEMAFHGYRDPATGLFMPTDSYKGSLSRLEEMQFTVTTAANSAGGLYGEILMRVDRLLVDRMRIARICDVRTGFQGDALFSYLSTGATFHHPAEGSRPAKGDPAFTQVVLTGREMAASWQISRRAMVKSGGRAAADIMTSVIEQAGSYLTQMILRGDNDNASSGQPAGLDTQAGLITTPTFSNTSGATPTLDNYKDWAQAVANVNGFTDYGAPSRAFVVAHNVLFGGLATPFEQGTYPTIITGMPGEMGRYQLHSLGFEVMSTQVLPADTGFFGEFYRVKVPIWDDFAVIDSWETQAPDYEVTVVMTYDVGLIQPHTFVKITAA